MLMHDVITLLVTSLAPLLLIVSIHYSSKYLAFAMSSMSAGSTSSIAVYGALMPSRRKSPQTSFRLLLKC